MKRKWFLGLLASVATAIGAASMAPEGQGRCWRRFHAPAWGYGYAPGWPGYYAPAPWCYGSRVTVAYPTFAYREYAPFGYGYTSIYRGCWPSYVYRRVVYASPVVSVPVIPAPVYFQPQVIYTPTFEPQTIYSGDCYSQSTTPQSGSYSGSSLRFSGSTSPLARTQTNRPAIAQASHRSAVATPSSVQSLNTASFYVSRDIRQSNPGATRVTKSDQVRPVQPYSPVWTESAVGLLDDMIDRGEWELAQQSCQRMEKIPSAKTAPVLLRQAVLDLVAHRESITTTEIDRLLERFDEATLEGSALEGSELRHGGLSQYLEASCIGLTSILDQLSQRALEQPAHSHRELLLLATLLALDNQQERAEVFAREAHAQAALEDSFRWHSLLRTLTPMHANIAVAP